MPHGPAHQQKMKKNIAVFLGVIGFIGLFWVITIVKIANNKAQNPAYNGQTEAVNTPEDQVQ
jgi:hypothetical protein